MAQAQAPDAAAPATRGTGIAPAAPVSRVAWRRRLDWLYPALTLVGIIAIWQLVVVVFNVQPYLVPAPSAVWSALVDNPSTYVHQGTITVVEVLLGFVLSVAIGVPLAVLLAFSKIFNRMLYPLLVVSQTVPKVAIAPLFLIWFGLGLTPKVAIVVLIAFFPIAVNGVVGFQSAPDDLVHLAQSMGMKKLALFRKVLLPGALPQLFAGMRVAVTLAVIGAVVAEFVGSDGGLGYLILQANTTVDTVSQFASIVLLSLIGIVAFYVIAILERIFIPWHASARRDAA